MFFQPQPQQDFLMTTWQDKANKIIADYSFQAWLNNKKKGGYTIPEVAKELVNALATNDEEKAKAIFLYGGINT